MTRDEILDRLDDIKRIASDADTPLKSVESLLTNLAGDVRFRPRKGGDAPIQTKGTKAALLDLVDCLGTELGPLAKPKGVPKEVRRVTLRACRKTVRAQWKELKIFVEAMAD